MILAILVPIVVALSLCSIYDLIDATKEYRRNQMLDKKRDWED